MASPSPFDAVTDKPFELMRKGSFSLLTGSQMLQRPAGKRENDEHPERFEKLRRMMENYLPNTEDGIQQSVVNHIEYSLACTRFDFDEDDCYRATALSVRDRLMESLNDTNQYMEELDPKRTFYLSAEWLIGRNLQNALTCLGIEENYRKALDGLGFKLEDLYEHEPEPALGNGGLGRLAACILESCATLNLPVWGYGLRYAYGLFEQRLVNGRQVEVPDYWLASRNCFEIPREDVTYAVRFYGHTERYTDVAGKERTRWLGGDVYEAQAYDTPVHGFATYNCVCLRLWKANPTNEVDFTKFSEGYYMDSQAPRWRADELSSFLYPNDQHEMGRELRLRQEYLFASASLQDILRSFRKKHPDDWDTLPQKVQIQLNDTHPAISIPELMRILIDVEGLVEEHAWKLTKQVFNYTNHTVMPEAMEKWSVNMLCSMLPRHVELMGLMNHLFLKEVRGKWGDGHHCAKMSMFGPSRDGECIRMAILSVIGSHHVNGVAALHSAIVQRDSFPELYRWSLDNGEPDKFVNCTNGVTPRRWLFCSNPRLAELITETLKSDEWTMDLSKLRALAMHKDDAGLQARWVAVKQANKQRLAQWVSRNCALEVDPSWLFDVQVKRIHEYKRQLLNICYQIHRFLEIKEMPEEEREKLQKRFCCFGGKAAPGYLRAKTIIKLINNVAEVVNSDPDVSQHLKIAFLPNYNVSLAQIIIPAADVSQHISTAGTEASGTSNMKFSMNGGLILGTMDGANIEICEEARDQSRELAEELGEAASEDVVFVFGAREEEVPEIVAKAKHGDYPIDDRLMRVFDAIRAGRFSSYDLEATREFEEIVDTLCNTTAAGTWHGDRYLLCHDFPSYVEAQKRVDHEFMDQVAFAGRSIRATAASGKFSADRTVMDYTAQVWDLPACPRPAPTVVGAEPPKGQEPARPVSSRAGGA